MEQLFNIEFKLNLIFDFDLKLKLQVCHSTWNFN